MPEHDSAYKLLFSQPRFVSDLFAEFVDPAISKELDFKTLKRCNGSYVADDLREREDDVIWQVRMKKKKKWVYVYLLLEFQSTVDRWMPVRIMTYTGLLYQDLIRQKKIKKGEKLPVIFPLVLYNGLHEWKAARSLDELVEPVTGALKRYRLPNEFVLIEEKSIPQEELTPGDNVMRLIFRLEQSKGIDEVQQILADFWPYIDKKELQTERRTIASWVYRVLQPGKSGGKQLQLTLQEAKSMLAERARTWMERAERRGMRTGVEKGIEKGIEKGRQEEKVKVVHAMAAKGMEATAISDLTNMPVAEVRKLLKES